MESVDPFGNNNKTQYNSFFLASNISLFVYISNPKTKPHGGPDVGSDEPLTCSSERKPILNPKSGLAQNFSNKNKFKPQLKKFSPDKQRTIDTNKL